MNENSSSLIQLHKLIRSLRKQEIEQIQQTHSEALNQIASIARENNLSLEHIQIALSVRQSKQERSFKAPRKSKRFKNESGSDLIATEINT
jgi:DNA-binding protein H-NS